MEDKLYHTKSIKPELLNQDFLKIRKSVDGDNDRFKHFLNINHSCGCSHDEASIAASE